MALPGKAEQSCNDMPAIERFKQKWDEYLSGLADQGFVPVGLDGARASLRSHDTRPAWTWSCRGWLNYVGAGYMDFAGSGIVHLCGGGHGGGVVHFRALSRRRGDVT